MVYSQTLSLSLFLFLLDQVPDEGTIFNLFSIETNLGLLSEFREFAILFENFNQFTARDNSKKLGEKRNRRLTVGTAAVKYKIAWLNSYYPPRDDWFPKYQFAAPNLDFQITSQYIFLAVS